MSNRKKQRVMIGTLCAIIAGMVVGYAVLNQVLTISGTSGINGDFNIQFTRIEENYMANATTISKGGVGTTTATFTVDLKKPGSGARYELEITNTGTIDATLTGIDGIEEANNTEPTDIWIVLCNDGDCYEVDPTDLDVPLKVGESITYYVEVYWDYDAETIPTTEKSFSLKLNYEQKTSIYVPPLPESNIASTYLLNNYLVSDVATGESGLVALDNTGEITTSTTPREYRYIGPTPDNYVQFNNELWRIIGIFDGQVKIMRANALGQRTAWNSNDTNDWSNATLQTHLNGEYLNSIDNISKGMISMYTWKLGGSETYKDVTAQMFYERERGTDKYDETRPLEWPGKIALMYPSDYGFSTNGNGTTNRSSCLAKYVFEWNQGSGPDACAYGSWMQYSTGQTNIWTLTPSSSDGTEVFVKHGFGLMGTEPVSREKSVFPSLYLLSKIKIASGSGKSDDPFILRREN